ncbi:MAG: ammonium transporter [Armatimonadota bacterium]
MAHIDSGDTGWMLIATALVMLMTPGLALFYGGMVRHKNVLGTMMQSLMALAVISIQWVLFGYTLAFGPSMGGAIGALTWIGLRGVGGAPNAEYAGTIPHLLFMAFQMMFAIITPALIFGAVAERMKFKAVLIFMLLWATMVYDPLAHWVWGSGGWLRGLGALDFAGGLVVHVSAGFTALVAALILGRRRGYPHEPLRPHNLSLTVIGAGLLWFGWFGFNAGSALGANGLAAIAFVNTNTAAAAAVLGWVFIEWWKNGKPTVLGAVSGAVAGLVAITPAAGYVEPWAAIIIGLLAGGVCYGAVNLRFLLGYDDSLDAFGVHGVGGMLGALLTGLFATKSVNPAGADGLFYGNPHQFLIQLISVAIVIAFVMLASLVLLKVTDFLVGLRVDHEAEMDGIDLSEHGETGYHLGDIPGTHGRPAPARPSLSTRPVVLNALKTAMQAEPEG